MHLVCIVTEGNYSLKTHTQSAQMLNAHVHLTRSRFKFYSALTVTKLKV